MITPPYHHPRILTDITTAIKTSLSIICLNSILCCKFVYIFVEGVVNIIAIIGRLGLDIVCFFYSLRIEIFLNIRYSVVLLAAGPAIISAIFIFIILAVLVIAIVLVITIFGSSTAKRPRSLCTR